MSIHPTLTNKSINFVCDSIKAVAENYKEWGKDYEYISVKNDYIHKSKPYTVKNLVDRMF